MPKLGGPKRSTSEPSIFLMSELGYVPKRGENYTDFKVYVCSETSIDINFSSDSYPISHMASDCEIRNRITINGSFKWAWLQLNTYF